MNSVDVMNCDVDRTCPLVRIEPNRPCEDDRECQRVGPLKKRKRFNLEELSQPSKVLKDSATKVEKKVGDGKFCDGYHDYADETPPAGYSRIPRADRDNTFCTKLLFLLDSVEEDGYGHVISWQPHGRCFIIRDMDQIEKILNMYLEINKLSSFQRQMYAYNFKRITKPGPDRGGYYHPKFLRGRTFLVAQILRGKGKDDKDKPKSHGPEPDFWSMPWVKPLEDELASRNQEDALLIEKKRKMLFQKVERTNNDTSLRHKEQSANSSTPAQSDRCTNPNHSPQLQSNTCNRAFNDKNLNPNSLVESSPARNFVVQFPQNCSLVASEAGALASRSTVRAELPPLYSTEQLPESREPRLTPTIVTPQLRIQMETTHREMQPQIIKTNSLSSANIDHPVPNLFDQQQPAQRIQSSNFEGVATAARGMPACHANLVSSQTPVLLVPPDHPLRASIRDGNPTLVQVPTMTSPSGNPMFVFEVPMKSEDARGLGHRNIIHRLERFAVSADQEQCKQMNQGRFDEAATRENGLELSNSNVVIHVSREMCAPADFSFTQSQQRQTHPGLQQVHPSVVFQVPVHDRVREVPLNKYVVQVPPEMYEKIGFTRPQEQQQQLRQQVYQNVICQGPLTASGERLAPTQMCTYHTLQEDHGAIAVRPCVENDRSQQDSLSRAVYENRGYYIAQRLVQANNSGIDNLVKEIAEVRECVDHDRHSPSVAETRFNTFRPIEQSSIVSVSANPSKDSLRECHDLGNGRIQNPSVFHDPDQIATKQQVVGALQGLMMLGTN